MSEESTAEICSWVQPKFRVGETVYRAKTTTGFVDIACPDCLGTKKWRVVTGSGDKFDINCQRCDPKIHGLPTYKVWRHAPAVEEILIRGIEVSQWAKDGKLVRIDIRYRGENGQGANEGEAFPNRADAEAKATVLADEQNATKLARERQQRTETLSIQSLRLALASQVEGERLALEQKYRTAVDTIARLKDDYIDGLHQKRTDDDRQELIARWLLSEIGEPTPDEWEDD